MSRVESFHFFIRELRSETSILSALQTATGINVESLDFPANGASGFLQMDEYTEGEFRIGCLASWRTSELETLDSSRLARRLCGILGTDILTEIPNPDLLWLLTGCNGSEEQVPIREVDEGVGIELVR